MGRTLQNTMVNLGLQNACDEAIYQVCSAFEAWTSAIQFVYIRKQEVFIIFVWTVHK